MVPFIGMGADTGKASVRYEKGAIVMDYDSNQQPIFKKIREAFRAAEMETGLKIWAIKKSITVHAWGGACLGPNPECGVIGHNGEVYRNPGLFIADASALPATVGTPPSLTIAAWAHHVADRLAQVAI
jgi:cholesterol oxidase